MKGHTFGQFETFFIERTGELRIFVLREREKGPIQRPHRPTLDYSGECMNKTNTYMMRHNTRDQTYVNLTLTKPMN
jgi:hypothetical protein